MNRSLLQALMTWKHSPARQPLLVRGARQTGKTFLVRQFAAAAFTHLVEINFEKQKQYVDCFQSFNVKQIIRDIEIRSDQTIVPTQTLLFFDEIQDCPNAIQALRYFYEELPELHVIGAGSLLEFALQAEDFRMPVGRVQFLYLYPMTFGEFLLASGKTKLQDYLQNISLKDKISSSLHQQLLQYVYMYFALGGMPRVVSLFVEHEKWLICREAQSALLSSYRDDFAKYATKVQQRYCERVFSRAPQFIAQHFKYSDIDPDMDHRSLKQAMSLLSKANVITPVYYSAANGLPLSATQVEKKFRLLFLDLGLAQAAARIPIEAILDQSNLYLNRGALTEQFVGQHLLTIQPNYELTELYYWRRDAKNSTAEIDYVIALEGEIIPLEVKSGKTGRLKSLHLFMESHQSKFGIKISVDEFTCEEKIWSLPLYMVEQIPRLVKEFLR